MGPLGRGSLHLPRPVLLGPLNSHPADLAMVSPRQGRSLFGGSCGFQAGLAPRMWAHTVTLGPSAEGGLMLCYCHPEVFFFFNIYLFFNKEGERREEEMDRNINVWLPLERPQPRHVP